MRKLSGFLFRFMRSHIWMAALLVFALASCNSPKSTEEFILSKNKSDGMYVFTVNMPDSTAVYDMEFYTRIDDSGFVPSGSIALEIRFTAPSGARVGETVYLNKADFRTRDSLCWDYRHSYRNNIRPLEPGQWTMTARVLREDDIPGLRGLGLRVSRR